MCYTTDGVETHELAETGRHKNLKKRTNWNVVVVVVGGGRIGHEKKSLRCDKYLQKRTFQKCFPNLLDRHGSHRRHSYNNSNFSTTDG